MLKITVVSVLLLVCSGCSTRPDPLPPLSSDHPANPQTAEPAYVPPANPFKGEIPSPQPKEAAAKPYPLNVCLVSDHELGSMGEPVTLIHEGREIKFCCAACIPEFKKDPAKFLKKLGDKR